MGKVFMFDLYTTKNCQINEIVRTGFRIIMHFLVLAACVFLMSPAANAKIVRFKFYGEPTTIFYYLNSHDNQVEMHECGPKSGCNIYNDRPTPRFVRTCTTTANCMPWYNELPDNKNCNNEVFIDDKGRRTFSNTCFPKSALQEVDKEFYDKAIKIRAESK